MSILRVNKIAASGQTSENTGSVYFDGDGDYLSIPNSSDFYFESQNFTIEGWINTPIVNSTYQSIFIGGYPFQIYTRNGNIESYFNDSDDTDTYIIYQLLGPSNSITANTWNHFAVVRNGSTFTCYVNGTSTSSKTSSSSLALPANDSNIGSASFYTPNTYPFQGYISNLRIIKGTALYTSNFTPPTRELEVTPETVLVACYDGENIFAEKTGKIIAAYGDRSSGIHTVGESPISITTNYPAVTRSVDVTAGPVLQGNLEYNSQNFLVLPKGTTEDRNRTGGRGLFAGGYVPSTQTNTIQYITISSSGNAQDFGDLTEAKMSFSGLSNQTRGLFASGYTPSNSDVIEYVNIASTGNGVDFGNITPAARRYASGCSSPTRGITAGGYTSDYVQTIEFLTIATLGDTASFGDLTSGKTDVAGLSSPTRGIFGGGQGPSPSPDTRITAIDFITIASTGDATTFGDLTEARRGSASASDGIRGIFAGGGKAPAGEDTDVIDYITIATTGSATDFGNLTEPRNRVAKGQVCNLSRGVFGGGDIAHPGVTMTNKIDYVTIQSTGNATDFGDLLNAMYDSAGCSDSHGGIS